MARRIRFDIKAKDEFWGRAFHVEWQDQFPHRILLEDSEGYYLAERKWRDDLERVGSQVFCRIVEAPVSPERRRWFASVLKGR
ncbi:MAG: hypothetical protein WAU45_19940 [Blastocatellia bacterium]